MRLKSEDHAARRLGVVSLGTCLLLGLTAIGSVPAKASSDPSPSTEDSASPTHGTSAPSASPTASRTSMLPTPATTTSDAPSGSAPSGTSTSVGTAGPTESATATLKPSATPSAGGKAAAAGVSAAATVTNVLHSIKPGFAVLNRAAIRGHITPKEAGRTVILQRLRNGRWVEVSRAKTGVVKRCPTCTSTWAQYTFTPKFDVATTWYVRTVFPVPGPWPAKVSKNDSFKWVVTLGPQARRVDGSDLSDIHRSGCPISPSNLVRLEVTAYGLDRRFYRGELILHESVTDDMADVVMETLRDRFPIQHMRNADAYGGSDVRSMRAGNTSAYNCRKVVGNPYRLSRHSWGDAIDINPFQNPYQDSSGRWYPDGSASYRDRSNRRPGMHSASTAVPRQMRAEGWYWGARWSNPDYHHFSRTGQ